jgi:hypothetical protein
VGWTTLIATLIGAAIATVTALLTENRKGRHDAAAEWRRTRHQMYAALLTSLSQARNGLLALLNNHADMTAEERNEAARRLFAPCYEHRHQFELVASHSVHGPALRYFREVRKLRDLVAAGHGPQGELAEENAKIKRTLDHVIKLMRADLQPDKAVPVQDPPAARRLPDGP